MKHPGSSSGGPTSTDFVTDQGGRIDATGQGGGVGAFLSHWQVSATTSEVLARFRPGAPPLAVGDVLTLARVDLAVVRVLAGPDLRHGQSVLLRLMGTAGHRSPRAP